MDIIFVKKTNLVNTISNKAITAEIIGQRNPYSLYHISDLFSDQDMHTFFFHFFCYIFTEDFLKELTISNMKS